MTGQQSEECAEASLASEHRRRRLASGSVGASRPQMELDFCLGAVGTDRGLGKFGTQSGWLSRHTAWPLSGDEQEGYSQMCGGWRGSEEPPMKSLPLLGS